MKNVTELFTRNNLSFLPFLLNKSPSVDISIFIFLKMFCILCFFGFFEEILLRLLRIAREAAAPFKNDLALTAGFALEWGFKNRNRFSQKINLSFLFNFTEAGCLIFPNNGCSGPTILIDFRCCEIFHGLCGLVKIFCQLYMKFPQQPLNNLLSSFTFTIVNTCPQAFSCLLWNLKLDSNFWCVFNDIFWHSGLHLRYQTLEMSANQFN